MAKYRLNYVMCQVFFVVMLYLEPLPLAFAMKIAKK